MTSLLNFNNVLLSLLAIVCIVGDCIVLSSNLHVFRALFDNTTHALIGGLSWLYISLNTKNEWKTSLPSHHLITEIGLCALVSSAIDLDHFVAAKSLSLKDATSLSRRPPLHSTTLPVLVCLLVLFMGYFLQTEAWRRAALIMLTAFLSHHTRDATRRGFWFAPFGSTPPVPYLLYIFMTCWIPYGICIVEHWFVIANHELGDVMKVSREV